MEYLELLRLNEDRNTALAVALKNFTNTTNVTTVEALLKELSDQFYVPTAVTEFVGAEIVELFQNDEGEPNMELMMSFHRFHAYLVTIFGRQLDQLTNEALDVFLKSALTANNNLITPKMDKETQKHVMLASGNIETNFTRLTRTHEMKVVFIYLALWDGTMPE